MTRPDFAAAHPGAAIILAGLALAASALLFALPVTLVSLVTSWRASRGMSAADRAALNEAAMWIRVLCKTNKLNGHEAMASAEKLERMAAR